MQCQWEHLSGALVLSERLPTMKIDELQNLAGRLRARRVEVADMIASIDRSSANVANGRPTADHPIDLHAAAQNQSERASRAHLATELGRIDAALRRADSGAYGKCCRCELPIEPERLRADSATPFCIECFEEVIEERRRQGYSVRSA